MKKRITSFIGIICLTICFLGATGCEKKREATEGQPTKVSLRLKWLYDPGFAGEMIAAKAGFFSKSGLDVDIKPGGFEADPIKLVASGADSFGVAGADSFLLARAKGVPIVAFGAGYLQTPVVFYVRADSGIKSPRDFIGKRVGVQAGQDTETVYQALLKRNGVSRDKIKEVPVKYDFTPFLARQVDVWPGYAATQSYILRQQKIAYNVIKPSDFGISYLGTVYFTSESYASAHPERVRALLDAIIEGWDLTYSDYARTVPMISSFDSKSLDPELVRFNLDVQREFIHPPGSRYCEFTDASWQTLGQTLVDVGLLPASVNLGNAYTKQFLSAYYNQLPK